MRVTESTGSLKMSLLYIKYEVEITNRLPTNTRYQTRISGPLLDRIDIRVEVSPVEFERPGDDPLRETAATIRARLEAARERQRTVTYVAGMERSRPAHLAETIQY
jgi:predicted ATPase with chaperone activity